MVCDRCIQAVDKELKELGLEVVSVNLGNATFRENNQVGLHTIDEALQKNGFELLQSDEEKTLEKIKNVITALFQREVVPDDSFAFSKIIAEKVGRSYSQLSTLFSRNKKITIERYIILQRIEKAKELIEYGELSFAEIAYKLGYKNPQHLSNQFKSITGLSMGDYKKLDIKNRKALNDL
jgi:AraC family transcriptional regulator